MLLSLRPAAAPSTSGPAGQEAEAPVPPAYGVPHCCRLQASKGVDEKGGAMDSSRQARVWMGSLEGTPNDKQGCNAGVIKDAAGQSASLSHRHRTARHSREGYGRRLDSTGSASAAHRSMILIRVMPAALARELFSTLPMAVSSMVLEHRQPARGPPPVRPTKPCVCHTASRGCMDRRSADGAEA